MGFEINATNSSDALKEFRTFLHEEYGLQFPDDKLYSLRNKINRRIRDLPCVESIVEYGEYLQKHDDEIHTFLDEVSTNKTYFFRESIHFDHMKDVFLPQNKGEIKIWSSACSTGPEPYSASMVLHDRMDGEYNILATDLSRDALSRAREAVYHEQEYERIRSYHPQYIRYMDPAEDHQCQVIDPITGPVCLRQFNLKTRSFPLEDHSFDLIFCRNVMIYFEQPMIQSMIRQFFRCLQPGGYLYIGRTETINNIDHPFIKKSPSIFRKPN